MQRIRKLGLGGGVALRHQHHPGIALAECLFDGGGVGTQTGVGAEHMGGTVVVFVVVGGQIAGHHDDGQRQRRRQHDAGHKPPELVKAGQQRLVVGLIHPRVTHQRQRRHEGEHGDKAQHHALGQRKAQVRADLELHEHQRQKTDDRGQAAGQDGPGGFAQGLHHAVLRAGVRARGPALGKAVDEEHRVIQRHGQLQDAAGGVGHKGNGAEHQVGAVVDEDGRPQTRQHQQRLHPGIGGQDQDEQHIHHRNGRDLGHLGNGGIGSHSGGHRGPGQGIVLPDQVLDGRHSLQTVRILHRHGEQRAVVLIIGLHRGGVLHLQRHGHIQAVVQPGHGLHAVDGGKFFFVVQCLGHRDVPHHDPHVGDAAGKGAVHLLQCNGGG